MILKYYNDKDGLINYEEFIQLMKNKGYDVSNFNKLLPTGTIRHELGESIIINSKLGIQKKIISTFDRTNRYFITSGFNSQVLHVYDIIKKLKIHEVEAHKYVGISSFLVFEDKLITLNENELFYWDVTDIKRWKILFKIYKKVKPVTGLNNELMGLIIDNQFHQISDKLVIELSQDQSIIKIERDQWVQGPLNQQFGLMYEHYSKSDKNQQRILLPDLLQNVIQPQGKTILQLIVWQNDIELIKEALKYPLQYLRNSEGKTPLYYALKRNSHESVNYLLDYISQSKELICLMNNSELCKCLDMGAQNLVKVLENAIEIVEDDNPKLGIMKNENSKQYTLSKYERNSKISHELLNLQVDEDVKKPIIFKKIILQMNYSFGSEESLKLHQALARCTNKEIFKTEFIDNLIRFKWNKVKQFLYLQLIVQVIFTAFIMIHLFQPGKWWPFPILIGLSFYFLILEIFTFVAADCTWKQSNFSRLLNIFLVAIYTAQTLNKPNQYINYLLPTINLISWLELTSQLQSVDSIRTFIIILKKCFQELKGFMLFTILMIFAFSTTQLIIEKNKNRDKAFNYLYDEYTPETYQSHNAYTNPKEFILDFTQSVYKSYFTFVKGDVDLEAENEDYYLFIFFILQTAIINVTLLNLVVSQMGEALQEVMTHSFEINNIELNELILQIETLAVLKRKNQNYMNLWWIDYTEQNAKKWQSVTMIITQKVQSIRQDLGEQIGDLKQQMENFSQKVNLGMTNINEQLQSKTQENQKLLNTVDELNKSMNEIKKMLKSQLHTGQENNAQRVQDKVSKEQIFKNASLIGANKKKSAVSDNRSIKQQDVNFQKRDVTIVQNYENKQSFQTIKNLKKTLKNSLKKQVKDEIFVYVQKVKGQEQKNENIISEDKDQFRNNQTNN